MDKFIQLPFTLNVAGHCGSGKTVMIRYLIKSLKSQLDCVVVISNTANFTEDYKFLDDYQNIKCKIFNSLSAENVIKALMQIQKRNRENDNKKNVLLIFDDVFGSIKDSKYFKDLVSTYRHYNISIIFSAQYISGSQTYLREISNYVVVFNQRTQSALKLAYEAYFAADFETFGEFKNHFKNSLPQYHFYFIDRKNDKKSIMVAPAKL